MTQQAGLARLAHAGAIVEQALGDAPAGESLAIVSHASILRLILTHYLGTNVVNFHRFRLAPGSVSVLQFRDDRELPRVLAVGWKPNAV